MNSLVAILVSIAALSVPVHGNDHDHECPGLKTPDLVTRLEFFDATVVTNTLHLEGGELRYNNVGTFENDVIDLRVTVTSGDYTDILTRWNEKGVTPDEQNGKVAGSKFGNINLQTIEGKPKSGEGNFRMCFVKQGTNQRVTLEQFSWSVYDLDDRRHDNREKLIINAFQAQFFQLWPNDHDSQVDVDCEDGSSLPCDAGVRTVFKSTTPGSASDNPGDPNQLGALAKKRSVVFTFFDKDCWDFTYDHYCPVEQPDYTGSATRCTKYQGGNFLFAGDSDEILTEGECITPAPVPVTPSPTWSPTGSPPVEAPVPVPNDPNSPSAWEGDGRDMVWRVKIGSIKSQIEFYPY